MANPTSNLDEIRADFVSLWDPDVQQHKELREWFVHQSSVATVEEVAVALPGGDTETRVVYPLESTTDSNMPRAVLAA
jgi:hypothetical protein